MNRLFRLLCIILFSSINHVVFAQNESLPAGKHFRPAEFSVTFPLFRKYSEGRQKRKLKQLLKQPTEQLATHRILSKPVRQESSKARTGGTTGSDLDGPVTNGYYDDPNNCTDWWLVTLENGVPVDEEYVGRSCRDDSNGGDSGGTGGADNNGSGGADLRRAIENDPGTNSCEKSYAFNHLYIGYWLPSNRKTVEEFIQQYFPAGNSNGDSPENAIKHALYQAINVCTIGATDTRAMAQLHEECNGVRPSTNASFDMDTFNNNVGVAIGSNWQLHGCDLSNIVGAVLDAYQRGQLHKINGQPTP